MRRLGWAGRVRIAARVTAMAVVLLVSLALYYAWRAVPGPNPWPARFLRAIGWLAGARVRIDGAPARGIVLILANHVTWLDILVLAGASRAAFVAHSGLAENALLKWLSDMNETVFVSRDRRASVFDQAAQVREALSRGRALAIFPEGSTSVGTGLLPFKSSLLAAIDPAPPGLVVQPVLLDYGPEAAATAWVGDESGLDNVRRVLARRRRVPVTVHFLDPFEPREVGGRKAIAAEARRRMAERLAQVRSTAAHTPLPADG
jgi:1-acyl-sn-glycerol-3-phosphate acyltransferase